MAMANRISCFGIRYYNNRTAIWYLNNNVFIGGRFGPTIPAGWSVVDVADFDRDGHPDYVLQNFNTNRTVIWYLNNNVLTGGAFGPTLPPASTSSQISWDLVAPLAGGIGGGLRRMLGLPLRIMGNNPSVGHLAVC